MAGQGETRRRALERIVELVGRFGIERRLEDEPAQHVKALDRLAEPEPGR